MKVAKITIEAPVTSFRYPHFLIGRQASYDFPPPSTIYGHIASALGEWSDPSQLRFGYFFKTLARSSDLEYQHVVTAGSGSFTVAGTKYPTAVSGNVQPHLRDMLFQCLLTLYLEPVELAEAFRHPAFCVVLGRSQDLAVITEVSEIELVETDQGYLENTLIPFNMRRNTGRGVTVLMPRYISPPPERRPYFERYIMLSERLYVGVSGKGSSSFLNYEGEKTQQWWADPDSPVIEGLRRCVVFHTFTDGVSSGII